MGETVGVGVFFQSPEPRAAGERLTESHLHFTETQTGLELIAEIDVLRRLSQGRLETLDSLCHAACEGNACSPKPEKV
jgi:hypothetical protein